MTDRPFVKVTWTTGTRNDGVWLYETAKATGDGESGTIELGPFKDRGEALAFAGARQRGIAEMMARMRAQMTLAMRGSSPKTETFVVGKNDGTYACPAGATKTTVECVGDGSGTSGGASERGEMAA